MGKFLDASFNHSVGSRTYKVYVPKRYHGQALPLLVMLHGCTQNPDDFAAGTRMNALTEKSACFAVYPSQPRSANPSRCWNWFNLGDQRRDHGEPAIIAGVTRAVMQAYHIDSKQVFIAGMSAGAAMAIIMAATYPELYAAVGVHSGLAFRSANNMLSSLDAMRNGAASLAPLEVVGIPLIAFHGDEDRTVNLRNSEQIISQWLQSSLNHPIVESIEEAGETNGRAYVRTQYRDNRGVFAEYWRVQKLGHAWCGGSLSGSHTDPSGPNASQEMLRFFLGSRSPAGLLNRLLSSLKPS